MASTSSGWRPQRAPEVVWGSSRRGCDVEIGDVDDARGHRRGRLYTRGVADESPELFDDIYLGLRAEGQPGNSARRGPVGRRRGGDRSLAAPLFLAEVYRDWGVPLGTFGLGLTVGGLIFGRWRTARR